MPYQLPPAAKTSKLLNLPADLRKLAEEALAEKFGLSEIVEKKPEPKKKKPVSPKDEVQLMDHRLDIRIRTGGGMAQRTVLVSPWMSEPRDVEKLITQVAKALLNDVQHDSPRGWGDAPASYYDQYYRQQQLVCLEVFMGKHYWEWREGSYSSIQELSRKIFYAIMDERTKHGIKDIRF